MDERERVGGEREQWCHFKLRGHPVLFLAIGHADASTHYFLERSHVFKLCLVSAVASRPRSGLLTREECAESICLQHQCRV